MSAPIPADGRRFGRLRTPGYGRTLGLVTALGAFLRLVLLARQPLGYDEDFTAAVVARPFLDMLDAVGRDSAPPLFYVLEWPAAHFVPGPAGLRLVPALAGIALIPLLATLARRAAGDAVGLWAAAFVAFVPAALLGSENARMYALAGTLVVAAMLLLWQTTERPTRRGWIATGAVAAAAVWTDYFAAVALLGVLAAVAWLRPPRRTLVIAAFVVVVAVATAGIWLLLAPTQLSHAGQGFWIPPLSAGSIAGTLGQLFAGPPVDEGVPGRELLVGSQVLALVAGAIALLAAALAVRPAADATRRSVADATRRSVAFLLIACGGVVALAVVSVWRPILEARYAAVMWLPLFALAGVGLAAMPRAVASAAIGAVLAASVALGGVAITHPQTTDLLPEIESRLAPADVVLADPNHYLALLAEGSPELRARLHVFSAQDVPWYFGTAAYPTGAVIHAVAVSPPGRVFWVADPGAAPPLSPAAYRVAESRCLIRVCLTVFEPAG